MDTLLELGHVELTARLNRLNRQFCSLAKGREYMWGGGKPDALKTPEERTGWPNSEITMFPIVGAAKDGEIVVDGVRHPMGQHGIARHLDWSIQEATPASVRLVQRHSSGDKTRNPKHPKEKAEFFTFPFDYTMERTYTLNDDGLRADFLVHNDSDRPMPYAIGWHPAFSIGNEGTVVADGKEYPLRAIKKKSETGALVLPNVRRVEYAEGARRVSVRSDFGHMTIWSPPGQNHICIEPVSAISYPSYDGELADKPDYKTLRAGESKKFSTAIEVG